MLKRWTIRRKLLLSAVGLTALTGLLIAGFSLREFTSFSRTAITDSYNALSSEGIEKMRIGLGADLQKIQGLLDTSQYTAKRLAASANMTWYFSASRQAQEAMKSEASRTLERLLELCDVQNNYLREKIESSLRVAEYVMTARYGSPSVNSLAPVTWEATNQMTRAKSTVTLPTLMFGATPLERQDAASQPVPIVDDLQRALNVKCVIFQRMNEAGDLLRIASNIQTNDGRRQIGAFLPEKHADNTHDPAIAALLKGETYFGREYLKNVWHLTAYAPISDAAGQMLGAIFLAIPQESELLKSLVLSTKIGQRGEAFVIDDTGGARIHRDAALVGKNLILETGISAFNRLLERENLAQTNFIEYAQSGRRVTVAYRRFPLWNWILCLSYHADEAEREAMRLAIDAVRQEMRSIYHTTTVALGEEQRPLFNQIRYIDAAGMEQLVLKDGDFAPQLGSRTNTEWFKRSRLVKPGDALTVGVEKAINTGRPEMRFAAPVTFEGEFHGIIVVNLDWQVAWELLKRSSYGRTGYAFIANERGMLVSHPRYTFDDQYALTDAKNGALAKLAEEKMLKGEAGEGQYTLDGVEKFAVFRPFAVGELAYSIGATTPISEYLTLAENLRKEIKEHYARTVIIVTIVTVVSLAAACGASVWISRNISDSVREVVNYTQQVSGGNLSRTLDVTREDEMGLMLRAINQMVVSLRTFIEQIQRSAIQASSSATELSATAREHDALITTQVASTKQVGESVREISDVTANLVETMQRVAGMSQETARFASSGQDDLHRMDDAMRVLESASKAISAKLQAINEKAENITAIVTTIAKVADQTNLLSLNAAIEAEKAGEYGRGFTVVAREIRRLADQTALATLDIGDMVREMQHAVASGVTEMDEFIGTVRRSAEDVEHISQQFAQIIRQIQAVSPQFDDVSLSMQYQAEQAQNINVAVRHLGEEMEETRSALHETFSAIEQLNEATTILHAAASQFIVTE